MLSCRTLEQIKPPLNDGTAVAKMHLDRNGPWVLSSMYPATLLRSMIFSAGGFFQRILLQDYFQRFFAKPRFEVRLSSEYSFEGRIYDGCCHFDGGYRALHRFGHRRLAPLCVQERCRCRVLAREDKTTTLFTSSLCKITVRLLMTMAMLGGKD